MSDGPRPDLPGIESETEEIDAIAVPAGEGPLLAPASSVHSLAAPMPPESSGRSLASHASQRHGLALLRSAPTVQVAAAAAGGLLAGAAVFGFARRRQASPAGRRHGRLASRARHGRRWGVGQGGADLLQIVGSRSLLLDVHLLGTAPRGRR